MRWRVGSKVPRNIYRNDVEVAVAVGSEEEAEATASAIVDAMNAYNAGIVEPSPDLPPEVRVEYVCKVCNDTHTMMLTRDGHEDSSVPCTRCPVPCIRCRGGALAIKPLGGLTAYCEKTPCECACHRRRW